MSSSLNGGAPGQRISARTGTSVERPAHSAAPPMPVQGGDVEDPGDLTRVGARGAMWQGFAQIVGKAVVLVTTVILARILSPEEYGLVALALVLIAYAETIADAGVAQALVYLPRSTPATRAALACSLVSGLVVLLAAFFAAPTIARLYDEPAVASLIRVLAFGLLASALGAVPEALLRQQLDFRRQSFAMVIRAIVTGALSIVLVLLGAGAWSLAWGTAAGSLAFAVACWVLLRERPPWRLWQSRRKDYREVIRFGLPVAASSLLSRLIFDVDYLIVGGVLGATALGFYTLAFRLPELVIINVFFVIASVAYPLYSRAREDPERLRGGYLKSIRLQSLYGMCAGVGLAVVAPLLVPMIFGEKWSAAVEPLVLLALYSACRSLGAGANEIYKAIGRPGLSIKLSILRLLILVPALLYSAHLSIKAVAAAQLVVAFAFVVLMQAVAAKAISLKWREIWAAIVPALACGVAVAVSALLLRLLPLPPVAELAVVVLGGVLAVTVTLLCFFRSVLNEVISLIRR